MSLHLVAQLDQLEDANSKKSSGGWTVDRPHRVQRHGPCGTQCLSSQGRAGVPEARSGNDAAERAGYFVFGMDDRILQCPWHGWELRSEHRPDLVRSRQQEAHPVSGHGQGGRGLRRSGDVTERWLDIPPLALRRKSARRKRKSGADDDRVEIGLCRRRQDGRADGRAFDQGRSPPDPCSTRMTSCRGALVKAGAKRAKTLRELAEQAEIVFASLPTPDVVREVALGAGGIVESGDHETVCRPVDDRTQGGPDGRRSGLGSQGDYGGGLPGERWPSGARNGTLRADGVLPGGRLRPAAGTASVFGKPIFVSEIPGAAQTMKLCQQPARSVRDRDFIGGICIRRQGGLDPATVVRACSTASSGRNTATLDKFPALGAARHVRFRLSTALAFKDVKLCLDEAEAARVPTPVGNAVRQILGSRRRCSVLNPISPAWCARSNNGPASRCALRPDV